jgi:Lrp/AsnC family leucine-responsive transcriptional regulator
MIASRTAGSHNGSTSIEGERFAMMKSMDNVDLLLLTELDADPRISTAELARRVGVSVPTARDRIRRLHETGVIRGYRLDIDPAALGLPVAAFVRVRPGPGQLPKIAELARSLPQVAECHRITGEDCFLVRVHAPDVAAFEEVLDRFLLYGQTTTSIIQSTPVPLRTPGLPGSNPGAFPARVER